MVSAVLIYLTQTATEYIPLGDRAEWSDVKPVLQNDGPNPLVAIMYSDECGYASVVTDARPRRNELLSRRRSR